MTDDAAVGHSSRLSSGSKSFSPVLGIAVICAVAFLLRYIYIVSLDHLLCQFGDAYFFLAGGSKLREFVCNCVQSGNFDFVKALPLASPNGMVAMGSINVSDRLMVDGPIFPSYLAIVQWLVGLNPGSLLFDSKAVQISLCNALLDSFTCLFIFLAARAAFGQKVGFIAAALFAIYPASIINTQSCYTEPFGCFILSAWAWLLLKSFARPASSSEQFKSAQKTDLGLFLILGIVTGLLTLTRPPFVFLPVVFAFVLTVLRLVLRAREARFSVKAFWPAVPLLAGMMIVVLPWLSVTHKATGHPTLFVNRLPAFNLYLGNQLSRDGWRAYPFPENISETVSTVTSQILDLARSVPVAFASMELRKIPRLWLGVWNEFQYPLFGISVKAQEVLHQLLLSLAIIGFLLLVTRRQFLQNYDAVISLVVAILAVQSLYLAFEPISRYTMTAVPLVVIMAGYALSVLANRKKLHMIAGLGTIAALIIVLQIQHELIVILETFSGSAAVFYIAPCLFIVLLAAGYVAIQKILEHASLTSRALNLALGAAFLCLAGLLVVVIEGNPELSEGKIILSSPVEMVRQDIEMPAQAHAAANGQSYLLLDMAQGQCPALLNLSIGDTLFKATPVPWWQVAPNQGFLEALSLSEKAMATSLYSYRQWYAVPVPASLVKYGATNTVTVAPATAEPLTIYGDSKMPGQAFNQARLPSLRLASWTKAFATYDHTDGRVYENMATAPAHSKHSLDGGKSWSNLDSKVLRLHFAVFAKGVGAGPDGGSALASERRELISLPAERTISGADPASMHLGESSIKFVDTGHSAPITVPGQSHEFEVSCQLSAPVAPGWAYIGVLFEGEDARGLSKKWTSSWQPYAVRTTKKWMPFYFADALPSEISDLHNLRVSVTGCSFYPDLLLLHQKKAIKSKVSVKDLRLTFGSRPSQLPGERYQLY